MNLEQENNSITATLANTHLSPSLPSIQIQPLHDSMSLSFQVNVTPLVFNYLQDISNSTENVCILSTQEENTLHSIITWNNNPTLGTETDFSTHFLLDTLSDILLRDTKRVITHFRPILMDLIARWLDKHHSTESMANAFACMLHVAPQLEP